MSHTSAARVAVPHGWVDVDPGDDAGVTQVITVADWDTAWGLRPTMTVTVQRAASEHIAARVIAEAQANLRDLHVVSIDPWRAPGSASPGRRLAFAHTEGDATLCSLLWVVTTEVGDVVVSAHTESTRLHIDDRAFSTAVAGIVLPPGGTSGPEAPGTADLARQARGASWPDVAPEGRHVRAAIVADPDARILVEASVDGASHRFDATLARDEATISATAPPRAAGGGRPDCGAGDPATTFRIPVTRLALAVAQWLGLGPAATPASEPVTVPISLVMNRLVDPSVPAPRGADPTTWQQPWFLWTLRSSATDSGLVMVDTGTSGQCAVMETDDEQTTRFAPLSSYQVWLTLNWLVSESLVA
jgi:hypothetical protein